MPGNSSMSAPAQKNGPAPVSTSPSQPPCSSSGRSAASDPSAVRPSTAGSPSSVTSAIRPIAFSVNRVIGRDRMPVVAEDWSAHVERERRRYKDGEARLPDDRDERQRQLTRMGNAAGGAGLALLMLERRDEAAEWFARAAERYRESFADARPGAGAGRSARSRRA